MEANKRTLKWLNNAIKGKRRIIFVLMLVQALISFSNVINAWYLNKLVDSVMDKNKDLFIRYAIIMVCIALLWLICGAINRYLIEYGKASIENRLKSRLIHEILNRDYGSVTSTHSAEWLNKLTSDTRIVSEGCTGILPNLFAMFIQLVGGLIVMFKIVPQYTIILVPTGLVLIVITYFFRKKLKLLHSDIQEADGRFRTFMSEHLENLMVVKAFSKEKNTLDNANKKMAEHKFFRLRRALYSDTANVGFGVLMRGSYVLCIIIGTYGILNDTLSYGSFIATVQLISQIQSPFANVSGFVPRFYSLISSCERLMLIENYDMDVHNDETINDFEEIELNNVAFAYPSAHMENNPFVLNKFNLKIKKNEFIGFVGASGCGKSTVLKILMCLYPINEGHRYITIENEKKELTGNYRSLFAYVPQGNQLMSGTIKDIVSFNNSENIDENRLNEALKVACADEFVDNLEKGVDYLLGEKGKGLSEGQIQRLAIARAIYSNKPILLLDEATSSLDSDTEVKLLNNLRKLKNKTVIIVTHRNTALDYCDEVISL